MRVAAGALAALPAFVAVALVVHAASDDSYYRDNQSYWQTHSDGRGFFVLAVAMNIVAVVALVASAMSGRPRIWTGAFLSFVGFVLGAAAWVTITAN